MTTVLDHEIIDTQHKKHEERMENQLLKERHEMCIRIANSMMTMIRIYQAQGDREESIKQCAIHGRLCLLEAKRIETLWDETTSIINIAA